VRLNGPELRAHTRVVLAFARPDRLRLEIPGPTGARLVVLVRGEQLLAVFPGERAFLRGGARAQDLEALLGIALLPSEIMDLLTGRRPAGLRACEVRWDDRLPRRIDAALQDGTRLRVSVQDADADPELPARAFQEPPHAGFRSISAAEARQLWSR
jgi:hypothetical protein